MTCFFDVHRKKSHTPDESAKEVANFLVSLKAKKDCSSISKKRKRSAEEEEDAAPKGRQTKIIKTLN